MPERIADRLAAEVGEAWARPAPAASWPTSSATARRCCFPQPRRDRARSKASAFRGCCAAIAARRTPTHWWKSTSIRCSCSRKGLASRRPMRLFASAERNPHDDVRSRRAPRRALSSDARPAQGQRGRRGDQPRALCRLSRLPGRPGRARRHPDRRRRPVLLSRLGPEGRGGRRGGRRRSRPRRLCRRHRILRPRQARDRGGQRAGDGRRLRAGAGVRSDRRGRGRRVRAARGGARHRRQFRRRAALAAPHRAGAGDGTVADRPARRRRGSHAHRPRQPRRAAWGR